MIDYQRHVVNGSRKEKRRMKRRNHHVFFIVCVFVGAQSSSNSSIELALHGRSRCKSARSLTARGSQTPTEMNVGDWAVVIRARDHHPHGPKLGLQRFGAKRRVARPGAWPKARDRGVAGEASAFASRLRSRRNGQDERQVSTRACPFLVRCLIDTFPARS